MFKKEVSSVVDSLRQSIDSDLKYVEDKIDQVSKSVTDNPGKDISNNIVIRNLPQSVNENLNTKVSALMREGLKLNNVSFGRVEHKTSRSDHKSGVVVVTCKSKKDVSDIMSTKQKLKSSRQYNNVFIHRDQTVEQRIERKNFQTIVDVLKSVDPNINMRGAEIIAKRFVNYQNSSDSRNERVNRDRRNSDSGSRRRQDRNSHRFNGQNNNNARRDETGRDYDRRETRHGHTRHSRY